jgi:hypothetical protein
VLSEEHASQLGQPAGRVVEGAKDLLAFPERECDSDAIRVEGSPQRGRCRLIDEVGECVDEFGRKGNASDDEQLRLDRAALHAPLLFGEQHAAQLRETNGRNIEHSQDRFAIGGQESNEILLGVERDKKRIARVLEAGHEQKPSQIGDVLVADGNTGEPHASDATRRHGRANAQEVAEPGTLSSARQQVSAGGRALLGELCPTGAPVLGVHRNLRGSQVSNKPEPRELA